jgi:hypothetical protein
MPNMKKLLLLAFVLAASINVYSQETLTGNEPGTTTGPTDPAEINNPPVRDGDPINPNPDPPLMSRCPDYCFENGGQCPLEVSMYYSSWQDCEGNELASTGMLRRVIVLQPGERKCFGFVCTNGTGCITIYPRFYFGIAAVGSGTIVQIERQGGTVPAQAIDCNYGVRIEPVSTPDGNYVYRIFTIWPPMPD